MLALNLLKQLCGRLCYSLTMEWSRLFAHLFVNSIKYIICGRSKVGLRLGDTTLVIPSHVSYLNCLTSSVSALVHLFTCLCVVLEETGCCVQTLKSLITCYRPPLPLKKNNSRASQASTPAHDEDAARHQSWKRVGSRERA